MLPHEGHVPTLPGRTNTGEKYIVFYSRAYEGRQGRYLAFSGARQHRPGRRTGQQRPFPPTPDGFADAIAYRDAILAGNAAPTQAKLARQRLGLRTEAQLDALRTRPGTRRQSPQPTITWRDAELLVLEDLRATYPEAEAFVMDVSAHPGVGSDILVTFNDGSCWFVEVKHGHTTLSRAEYERAVERGEDYILAFVSKKGVIRYIGAPALTGTFETVVTTRYRWRAA